MAMAVYITCGEQKEAKRICMHLLNQKLVACCNLFPIESMYWWKKDIEYDKEYAIIAKTVKKNLGQIKSAVRKVHSYKVPSLTCYEIKDGDPNFLKWIEEETKK